MKSLILASAFAASLVFGLPSAAEAHRVGFQFFFGMPHYGYNVGPGYRYRPGYGWYNPGYREAGRLSCGGAKSVVRNRGYRNVATIECRGRTYTFRATRNGERARVFVNSRTGAVWRG